MSLEDSPYPRQIKFTDLETPFGSILFDFVDDADSFIIIFSANEDLGMNSFFEGEISIRTNPDDFELDKNALETILTNLIPNYHPSGGNFQHKVLTALRNRFSFIELSDDLSQILEP